MTKYEKLVLRAAKVADYFNSHKGATITETASALNLSHYHARKGYLTAAELNFIEQKKFHTGARKGMRQATIQKAREISDYFKSHEGAKIADAAKALNYSQGTAYALYHTAVRLNLIETGKFRQGRKGHLPETLEKITQAVELRRQGKSLRAVGADMGISRERVRQFLKYAVKQGSMNDKERADLNRRRIKNYNWAYFFELAGQIENINAETYHALVEKHWHSAKHPVAGAGAAERQCLEKLVQHADPNDPDGFTKEDAELMVWVLHKLKLSKLSLSELKKMTDEYITTDIKLPDLGAKYGIAEKTDISPAAHTSRYLRFAEKLNLVSREDCRKKGSKTQSETSKKSARKYPEHIIKTAIESCEKGIPCSEVAQVFGIHLPTLNTYVYKNRKEQAKSSKGQ